LWPRLDFVPPCILAIHVPVYLARGLVNVKKKYVPMSPSSIIWYRPMGSSALWFV